MNQSQYVHLNTMPKDIRKEIVNGAQKGKYQTYAKHTPTGASIPIDPASIEQLQQGAEMALHECERKYNRSIFSIYNLERRWDKDADTIKDILNDYNIPYYHLLGFNGIRFEGVFEEYIFALETKRNLKKHSTSPEWIPCLLH